MAQAMPCITSVRGRRQHILRSLLVAPVRQWLRGPRRNVEELSQLIKQRLWHLSSISGPCSHKGHCHQLP
eukprot:1156722-Pelagomonas_calceolata.AAC.14